MVDTCKVNPTPKELAEEERQMKAQKEHAERTEAAAAGGFPDVTRPATVTGSGTMEHPRDATPTPQPTSADAGGLSSALPVPKTFKQGPKPQHAKPPVPEADKKPTESGGGQWR